MDRGVNGDRQPMLTSLRRRLEQDLFGAGVRVARAEDRPDPAVGGAVLLLGEGQPGLDPEPRNGADG